MAHFPNLWGKKSFSKKSGCHAQLQWLLAPWQNPEKSMIQFKKTPRQISGGKDAQILFHGILPATARGLASKTAVNWHLKVKDIEYNVGLTKNYCITVSMQKISSIHKLTQQILGSHELNDYTHF